MGTTLTIGDFSRMTHLSIKTLRHYHQVRLLEPVEINPESGYRYYDTEQVPTAQVIRRFRDLGMPVEQVKAVLDAPDLPARNALIASHLERLEHELHQTQAAVTSLRNLLDQADAPIPVEHRGISAAPAMAISETVTSAELGPWWSAAFGELEAFLSQRGIRPTGPKGGLYGNELFLDERGDAVVYVPVAEPAAPDGRVHPFIIPAAELAIATHAGPESDIDRTYGALGTYVAEHALGVEGPVRESYLVSAFDTPDASQWKTEIGWPIFRTAGR
jgi:DNA-binding transcriptional MerR regulator/effector-binding domain-containing protein